MASSEAPQQEDKTEEATPERREEFRERGQVVVSRELSSTFVLAAAAIFTSLITPTLMNDLSRLLTTNFEQITTKRIDEANFLPFIWTIWKDSLFVILPFFAVTFLVSSGTTFAQTRLNWSWQRLKPDFSRLDPLAGLKRMVSLQAVVELCKSLAKMATVGLVTWLILRGEWVKVPELMSYPMLSTWKYWGQITEQLFWAVAGLLLLVAGADYFYNWITHERQIKMTKQEVKEEYKRRESDPMVKARLRRMQRDLLTRKTLKKTKEATVLVTNPTHFSIALKYELGMPAPIVIAKGVDFLALRMREVAKEEKIPIIENRPLARELYATVKEGQEIPDRLYKVVAEIIRYVFKLKGRSLSRNASQASVTNPPIN